MIDPAVRDCADLDRVNGDKERLGESGDLVAGLFSF
jgi:hypothetical protein